MEIDARASSRPLSRLVAGRGWIQRRALDRMICRHDRIMAGGAWVTHIYSDTVP